jgi:hypothetical protein
MIPSCHPSHNTTPTEFVRCATELFVKVSPDGRVVAHVDSFGETTGTMYVQPLPTPKGSTTGLLLTMCFCCLRRVRAISGLNLHPSQDRSALLYCNKHTQTLLFAVDFGGVNGRTVLQNRDGAGCNNPSIVHLGHGKAHNLLSRELPISMDSLSIISDSPTVSKLAQGALLSIDPGFKLESSTKPGFGSSPWSWRAWLESSELESFGSSPRELVRTRNFTTRITDNTVI